MSFHSHRQFPRACAEGETNRKLDEYRSRFRPGMNDLHLLSLHFQHCRERTELRLGVDLDFDTWEALNWKVFLEVRGDVRYLHVKNALTTVYEVTLVPKTGRTRKVTVYFSEDLLCVTTVLQEGCGGSPDFKVWSSMLARRRQCRIQHAIAKGKVTQSSLRAGVEPSNVVQLPTSPTTAAAAVSPDSTLGSLGALTAGNVDEVAQWISEHVEAATDAERQTVIRSLCLRLEPQQSWSGPTDGLRETGRDPIDQVIGLTLSKATKFKLPVGAAHLTVSELFRAAAQVDHPLQAASKAFISRHRLMLREGPVNGRGRPATIVCRSNASIPGVL